MGITTVITTIATATDHVTGVAQIVVPAAGAVRAAAVDAAVAVVDAAVDAAEAAGAAVVDFARRTERVIMAPQHHRAWLHAPLVRRTSTQHGRPAPFAGNVSCRAISTTV